mmetsp:Transcript_5212/g.9099  ORF Transcript_5212/g.9099 Transcript_5212/m.9099 type:complete len:337 (-) Transcript_5212:7-1017(-)
MARNLHAHRQLLLAVIEIQTSKMPALSQIVRKERARRVLLVLAYLYKRVSSQFDSSHKIVVQLRMSMDLLFDLTLLAVHLFELKLQIFHTLSIKPRRICLQLLLQSLNHRVKLFARPILCVNHALLADVLRFDFDFCQVLLVFFNGFVQSLQFRLFLSKLDHALLLKPRQFHHCSRFRLHCCLQPHLIALQFASFFLLCASLFVQSNQLALDLCAFQIHRLQQLTLLHNISFNTRNLRLKLCVIHSFINSLHLVPHILNLSLHSTLLTLQTPLSLRHLSLTLCHRVSLFLKLSAVLPHSVPFALTLLNLSLQLSFCRTHVLSKQHMHRLISTTKRV